MGCNCGKSNTTKAGKVKEVTRRDERRAKYEAERDRRRAEAGREKVQK